MTLNSYFKESYCPSIFFKNLIFFLGGGFGEMGDVSAGDALTLGLGQSEYDRRKKKK